MQTQSIAIDQLVIDELNVREAQASPEEDAQLAASIDSFGIMNPLLVVPIDGSKGAYSVFSGGRRLAAVHKLNERDGAKQRTHVPCIVGSLELVKERSLAANISAPIHPADEFIAYKEFIDDGATEEDIAKRFGIDVVTVKKRMKLGDAHTNVLMGYRSGNIDLRTLKSFTVLDKAAQAKLYKKLGKNCSDWQVRQVTHEDKMTAASSLCKYVGETAYRKAGGTVVEDLFSHQGNIWNDTAIVTELAQAKLERYGKKVEKEGWGEVQVIFANEYPWHDNRMTRIEQVPGPDADQETVKELAAVEKEMEAWEALEWPQNDKEEEQHEDVGDEIQERLNALNKAVQTTLVYNPEHVKHGIAYLHISSDGRSVAERGYISRKVLEGLAKPDSSDAPSNALLDETSDDAMPAALNETLGTARQEIVQHYLKDDNGLAFDLCAFDLAYRFDRAAWPGTGLSLRTESRPAIENEVIAADLYDLSQALRQHGTELDWSWVDGENARKSFLAFQKLDQQMKLDLLTWVISRSLYVRMAGRGSEDSVVEEVIKQLDIDWRKHFGPTVDNYFGILKNPQLQQVACEQGGELAKYVEDHPKGTKKKLATFVADNIDDSYLPPGMKAQ